MHLAKKQNICNSEAFHLSLMVFTRMHRVGPCMRPTKIVVSGTNWWEGLLFSIQNICFSPLLLPPLLLPGLEKEEREEWRSLHSGAVGIGIFLGIRDSIWLVTSLWPQASSGFRLALNTCFGYKSQLHSTGVWYTHAKNFHKDSKIEMWPSTQLFLLMTAGHSVQATGGWCWLFGTPVWRPHFFSLKKLCDLKGHWSNLTPWKPFWYHTIYNALLQFHLTRISVKYSSCKKLWI